MLLASGNKSDIGELPVERCLHTSLKPMGSTLGMSLDGVRFRAGNGLPGMGCSNHRSRQSPALRRHWDSVILRAGLGGSQRQAVSESRLNLEHEPLRYVMG